jgi:hypothetical protein
VREITETIQKLALNPRFTTKYKHIFVNFYFKLSLSFYRFLQIFVKRFRETLGCIKAKNEQKLSQVLFFWHIFINGINSFFGFGFRLGLTAYHLFLEEIR